MSETKTQHVVITGLDIPFMDLTYFILRWCLASIPAAIILFILGFIAAEVLGGFFSGFFG